MPNMDMEAFFTGRKAFTEDEWLDVLLRSTGMEPTNFDKRVKWHLLARMIPLVERLSGKSKREEVEAGLVR
jgi:ATP-dependent Lon protease